MDHGEARGALTAARDDERGDLDQLAVSAGRRTGVTLSGSEVRLGRGGVAVTACPHGEEGMGDRARGHGPARRPRGAGVDVHILVTAGSSLIGCPQRAPGC